MTTKFLYVILVVLSFLVGELYRDQMYSAETKRLEHTRQEYEKAKKLYDNAIHLVSSASCL